MMDGNDLETQAALYALGHLDGEELTAFETALRQSGTAARSVQAFRQVMAELAHAVPAAEPPAGLRTRLLEQARQGVRPAPEPGRITLAPGIMLVRAERLAWQETGVPGVRFKLLFVDRERHYASSLVEMAPRTTYPRHRHAGIEELFMLSGDIRIGAHRLGPGDYCRSEADTVHEPIDSETGAVYVALGSLDDDFVRDIAARLAAAAPM